MSVSFVANKLASSRLDTVDAVDAAASGSMPFSDAPPTTSPSSPSAPVCESDDSDAGSPVMVDMVDTYANVSHIQCTVSDAALLRHRYRALPKKLRLFYRYLAEQVEYDYVLKIDDDTYTNIERYAHVYTNMHAVHTTTNPLTNEGAMQGAKTSREG